MKTQAETELDFAAEHRVGHLLRRAYYRAKNNSNRLLKGLGVTPMQAATIMTLQGRGALSQADLGRAIGMEPANVHGLVARLKNHDLIVVEPHPTDARQVRVALSTVGERYAIELAQLSARSAEDTLEPLTAAERETLMELLTPHCAGLTSGTKSSARAEAALLGVVPKFVWMFRGWFKKKSAAAALSTEPLKLVCGPLEFLVGFTTRAAIEQRIGPAIEYPAAGWRSWSVAGALDERWVLSAIFRGQMLIGIEHYLAKTDNLPGYAPPASGIFLVQPGAIGIGTSIADLPARFVSASGNDGGARSVVFQHLFQARWVDGIALVSGNDQRVERIALYAQIH